MTAIQPTLHLIKKGFELTPDGARFPSDTTKAVYWDDPTSDDALYRRTECAPVKLIRQIEAIDKSATHLYAQGDMVLVGEDVRAAVAYDFQDFDRQVDCLLHGSRHNVRPGNVVQVKGDYTARVQRAIYSSDSVELVVASPDELTGELRWKNVDVSDVVQLWPGAQDHNDLLLRHHARERLAYYASRVVQVGIRGHGARRVTWQKATIIDGDSQDRVRIYAEGLDLVTSGGREFSGQEKTVDRKLRVTPESLASGEHHLSVGKKNALQIEVTR